MAGTVVLTGLGHLGGPLLDRLAAGSAVDRVVALSRDAERGTARCNLASLSAAAVGVRACVEHRAVDIANPGMLAAAIDEIAPDAVIHSASMQTWWLLDRLPAEAQVIRKAGFGAWLPVHLTLAIKLMEELADAGYEGLVINAAYPDVINVILARMGLAPSIGVGNVDELVAKVRMVVGRDLSLAPNDLEVFLVAHHALQRSAFGTVRPKPADLPPFHLWVGQKGRDLTHQADATGALVSPCPMPGGPAWGIFTAASAAGLVGALLSEGSWRMHAPGPLGLPGGYPVDVGSGNIAVSPIPGLSLDEAVAINEASHRFDGIERIEDDGTVVLTESAANVMRDALGYEGKRLRPADAAECAAELSRRFHEYAQRHGVDLETLGR